MSDQSITEYNAQQKHADQVSQLTRKKAVMSDIIPPTNAADWDKINAAIVEFTKRQVRQALDSIGEPTLASFKGVPTPEEYQWSIKVIRWYKERIQQAIEEQKERKCE